MLGLLGISTLLIERNPDLCTFPRAISIDDEGLRVCQALGLGDILLPSMRLGTEAHYISGPHYLARVAPLACRNGFPLISTFHQPTFERALLQGLERFPHVHVRFQYELVNLTQAKDEVFLSLRQPDGGRQQIKCSYVLACDGGRSPIRHMLDLGMRPPSLLPFSRRQRSERSQSGAMQRWLVVDCAGDDDPSNAIIFFCNPKRPAVTVPAPNGGRRWEFMLHPHEQPDDLLRLERIQELIMQSRRSQRHWSAGKPACVIRQAVYTFYATMASRLFRHRVFLLGDAAHLMPPFGGQGMNSGLRDVHNLCWKLSLVFQGNASPHLLASYQTERVPHVREMILFSSALGHIIMPTSRRAALARDLLLRGVVARIPPLVESLREMRVKPQPRYKRGLILPATSLKHRHLPGTYLPQPQVLTLQGRSLLFDDLLCSGFALLKLSGEANQAEQPLMHPLWSTLQPRYIVLLPPSSTLKTHWPEHITPVVDSDGSLRSLFGSSQDTYLLVRPDRYILGVFRANEEVAFARRLIRLLSP
ncbi:FAD-dependent monooxygenase [Ktedonospora formicarum]|nr:FAD-dependent monooxygenase [Ktedonospora formicarum]